MRFIFDWLFGSAPMGFYFPAAIAPAKNQSQPEAVRKYFLRAMTGEDCGPALILIGDEAELIKIGQVCDKLNIPCVTGSTAQYQMLPQRVLANDRSPLVILGSAKSSAKAAWRARLLPTSFSVKEILKQLTQRVPQ